MQQSTYVYNYCGHVLRRSPLVNLTQIGLITRTQCFWHTFVDISNKYLDM